MLARDDVRQSLEDALVDACHGALSDAELLRHAKTAASSTLASRDVQKSAGDALWNAYKYSLGLGPRRAKTAPPEDPPPRNPDREPRAPPEPAAAPAPADVDAYAAAHAALTAAPEPPTVALAASPGPAAPAAAEAAAKADEDASEPPEAAAGGAAPPEPPAPAAPAVPTNWREAELLARPSG